jgi:hypothetical protein
VQTTGGVTYFSHTATLDICNYTVATNQGLYDNIISMYAAEMQGQICPDCFGCTHVENGVNVLGALAPGDYALKLYTPDYFGGPGPILHQTYRFTVPTDSGPTLRISNGPNADQVTVEVNGHPLANYTLVASADLKTWKSVITKLGAPCSFQLSTSDLPRFFKVQVSDGP